LPFVGNDIIDLKDPANAKKNTDLRFLKKILADGEIQQVRNSSDPDRTLWSFWACKEAAFKVLQKIAGDAAFTPRRWSVSFNRDDKEDGKDEHRPRQSDPPCQGVVSIPRQMDIPFILHTHPDFIHCIAADTHATLARSIRAVNHLSEKTGNLDDDPSAFGRLCLAKHLGDLFSGGGKVDIRRAEKNGILQPPAAYLQGMPVKVDISLSHDGVFAAYAFVCL
jgi:hypothetical protein